MDDKVRWTVCQKILLVLTLISFFGFIIYLVLCWDPIPERLVSKFNAGGEVIRYSKKAFTLVPVSYTHLDVYKRQWLSSSLNTCACMLLL